MAELKLKVSLDTSYLKGQIARLPLEFAGANVSIRPKFDKQSIVSEFAALNRYINSKRFNIVINTNLEAEIKNADRLVKALGRVQQAASGAKGGLPIGTQALSRTKGQGGFAAAEIKALFGAAVQGGLIYDKTLASTRAQMVTALGRIGKDSMAGLLNGLKSGDADIQAAAQVLGKNLITSFKTVLGIASPSKEFKKLGEAAGQGFEQGLLKSIEIAEQSATRKMQRMLDRLARMVLMMGGMSGPEIGRQIAQARALPSLNFGATTPRTSVAIGPSSTGRALPAGADRPGLPGTSFTSQKLLSGDLLTPSMKAAIRDAANEFVDNLRGSLNNAIREVNVRDLGRMGAPMLGGIRTAGFLPAGVGRSSSPYSTGRLGREGETRADIFARREREARMRSALRGVDIMGEGGIAGRSASPYSYAYRGARPQSAIVPYSAGGAIVPVASRGGGGGGGGGGTGGGPGNFAGRGGGPGGGFNMPNLPGGGLVREIGQEFAFATKQVLLFGTAYKALAFATSFPAQVGQAVAALQSFNNTLKAISPSAKEVQASNDLILQLVDKYNIPLQSARDGFTKLYASMQSAGFAGNEVRDIFTGISKAAATFGMSADKVDRVNYAFAQMASKGQVMSEELKGQLGDVLPGALGIFAEAAGFKGPDAIQKFSAALEDGAYKGQAMKQLLTNVGVVMNKEFGPGAEGAARTFQGVMNRMQNSLTLLYESFEPIAVGFLNSIVMPMTAGIQTLTDGFGAFFAGQAAQTAGGSAFAKQLEALRPAFEGIAANIKQILPLLQSFVNTALSLGQVLLQIAGNPFVGYLARIYLSVLPLTMALRVLNLQVLIPLIASFLRAIPAFVAFNAAMITGTGANKGLQLAMQLTGQTAGVTAGKIRLVGAALATLGTSAILLGIGLLIERFLMMKSAIDGVRQSTQQMLGSISGMANSGAVKELENVSKNIQKQKTTFNELKEFVSGGVLGGGKKGLTQEMADKFKEVGMGSFVSKNLFGKPIITDFLSATEIIEARLQGLNKESSSVTEKLPMAQRIAADIAKQAKAAESAASSQGVTGEDEANKKKTSLESYYSLQDQLAKNFTQAEIDRLEAEHQHKIDLIKSEYDLKEARANSFQKEALRFERRMVEITLERQGALLKASNAVMAAQGSVAGGAGGGGSPVAGATGLLQGNTGISGGAHFHISRADGSPISADQARAMLDPSVRRQVIKTSDYGPRRAPVPGASTFHRGVDLAGPANTPLNLAPGYSMVGQGEAGGLGYAASIQGPQGEMYKVGHLQRPAAGAGAARKVPSSEKRDIVADQKTQLEQLKQSTTVRQAEAKAIKDAEVALADFVATATPVEEQKLQNDLLKRRTELMMQGYSDSAVDQALKFAEAEYKVNFALKLNEELEKKGARTKADADAITKQMTEGLTAYSSALEENTKRLRDNRLVQAMTTLKDRMSMAGAMTPDQELREQIRQRNPDFSPAEQESLFQQEKLVQSAEKLKADMQGIAGAIGDSFGNAFKGVITGSMTAQEALAGFFQSVADSFADMVAKMIAEYLKMALIKGIMSIIGGAAGALGGGLSSAFGASGPSFNAGAFSGPALSSGAAFGGAGVESFSGAFSGGAAAFNPAAFSIPQFANGGVVTGPTLGLVGEGRYNEAVIPLPDGKSVPVQLSGGDGGNQINSNITVNVSNGQAQSNATGSNSSELGRKIEGAVKQVIVGELRPGGLLASR